MIDLYCERLGAGFWAEPLNATTNVAFLVAAWLIWRSAYSLPLPELRVLAVLCAAIGLGSFSFHTFATRWSQALDVVPIGLYQGVFFWLYLRNVMGWRRRRTVMLLAAFALSVAGVRLAGNFGNGSLTYFPALAMLLGMGWADHRNHRTEPRRLLVAGLLFATAVGVRSADLVFCPTIPAGTHFVWHLGAAATVGMSALAYAANARRRKQSVSLRRRLFRGLDKGREES